MSFVAKVAPQLQSTACTGSADCGPSSVIEALYLASGGAWMPSTGTYIGTSSSRGAMVTRIRKAGGISTLCSGTGYPIGSSVSSLATAFNAIASQDFAGVGMKTVTAGGLSGSSYVVNGPSGFDTNFRPKLEAGKHALVLLKYTAIDTYNNHAITGQCNATFTHILCVTAYRLVGTVPWVTILDPLADGRYSSSCGRSVASGQQQLPLSVLKTAMGGLSTGTGGAQAFTFSTAAPLSATNDAPIARATASTTAGQVPFTVSFSASTSTDPNGNTMTYAWDLSGNGLYNNSTSISTTKTFTTAGQYPIGLRVTDSLGASDTDSILITATDTPPPSADVDPFPYDPCAVEVLPG